MSGAVYNIRRLAALDATPACGQQQWFASNTTSTQDRITNATDPITDCKSRFSAPC
jgi:hypothetical protein